MPIVAVSEERHTPDDPSKASADRLRIQVPAHQETGSRKILQSDVPGQENTSQASGDRSHFTDVQAPGGSRTGFNFSTDRLSGEPTDSHNVVVEQAGGPALVH